MPWIGKAIEMPGFVFFFTTAHVNYLKCTIVIIIIIQNMLYLLKTLISLPIPMFVRIETIWQLPSNKTYLKMS